MVLRSWIPVSKLNHMDNPPVRSATAHKWHSAGRFPEIFKKVGGRLWLDLDEFYRIGDEHSRRKCSEAMEME
jgi:hypothetical protein